MINRLEILKYIFLTLAPLPPRAPPALITYVKLQVQCHSKAVPTSGMYMVGYIYCKATDARALLFLLASLLRMKHDLYRQNITKNKTKLLYSQSQP